VTQDLHNLRPLFEFKQLLITFGVLDHDGSFAIDSQNNWLFRFLHLAHHFVAVALER